MQNHGLSTLTVAVLVGISIPIALAGGGYFLFLRAEAHGGRGYILDALERSRILAPTATSLWACGVDDSPDTDGCATFVVDPSKVQEVEAAARKWLKTDAASSSAEHATLERARELAKRFGAPKAKRLSDAHGLSVLPSGRSNWIWSDAVVFESATGRVWFFRFEGGLGPGDVSNPQEE